MMSVFWRSWQGFVGRLFHYAHLGAGDASDPHYFARFPVFVTGLGLFWVGLLALINRAWLSMLSEQRPLFSWDVSLLFIVLGLALFLSLSHVIWSRCLAAVALLVGFLWSFGPWGHDSLIASIAPFHAFWHLVLPLLSFALILATAGRAARRVARGIAALTVLVCVVFFVFWPEAYLNQLAGTTGVFIRLALILVAALAVGSVAKRRHPESPFVLRRFLVINLAGSFLSVACWYFLVEDVRSLRHRSADLSARAVAESITVTLQNHSALLKRMVNRWEALGQVPGRAYIQQDLASYITDNPYLGLIAVVSADNQIVEEATSRAYLIDVLRSALEDPRTQNLFAYTRVSDFSQLLLSESLLPRLRNWYMMLLPLERVQSGWFIVALHDPVAMVRPILDLASADIGFRIKQNNANTVLYDSVGQQSGMQALGHVELPVQDGLVWTLEWWQKKGSPSRVPPLPDLMMLGGLLLTVLLSRFAYLSSLLGRHAQQLSYQTLHDRTTDLPNQRMLERELALYLEKAEDTQGSVAVVLFSISGLKRVNDSRGYQVGNAVLARVAGRIRSAAAQARLIARLDRGEFVAVCTDCDRQTIADQITATVAHIREPYRVQESVYHLDVSVGVSLAKGRTASPDELLREAELAAALARRDGKAAWQVYSEALTAPAIERVRLSADLRQAFKNDALQVLYQPVVDIRTGFITSVHASVQWVHPQRGVVPPDLFIPLAEETGQAIALGQWMLQQVCRDMLTFMQKAQINFPGVVTVSHREFWRADFVHSVRNVLEDTRLSPRVLTLAVTDELFSMNVDASLDALRELNAMGVGLVLERLGVGNASLRTIRKMPVSRIKIDPAFIKEVVSAGDDAAITRSIISLAHHLDLRVVAEGVETEAQYWFLRKNYCDEVQGGLFGAPCSAQEFLVRLQRTGARLPLPMAATSAASDKVLLLVDDEPNILRALTRLLRRDGYRILTADTPEEALVLLAQHPVQVIVSDQRMPSMTGTEFFARVKDLYPKTVRLILSGYTDLKSVTDAINHGAIYRFLTKPWDDEELRDQIAQAFRTSEGMNKEG